jgi:hypothetical protein
MMNLSLTPGFSPVLAIKRTANRFNGLPVRQKPLKRFQDAGTQFTGLKPGVNETKKARELVARGLSDEMEHRRVFEL